MYDSYRHCQGVRGRTEGGAECMTVIDTFKVLWAGPRVGPSVRQP